MATQDEESVTYKPTPSVRSILKKTDVDIDAPPSSGPQKEKKKSGRCISFDDKVTMHYSNAVMEAKLTRNDDDNSDLVENVSNGEPALIEEDLCAGEGSEVSEQDVVVKSKKHSTEGFKGGLKTRMGSILKRSQGNRTQVQGDSPSPAPTQKTDLQASGGTSFEKKAARLKRRSTDTFTASEIVSSTASMSGKTRSLTRMNTADSAEIFTRRNKSLRSKITKWGKYLKPGGGLGGSGGEAPGDEPVLTRVTPLGGSRVIGNGCGGVLSVCRGPKLGGLKVYEIRT